jgi:hypothetical protein
MLFVSNGGKFKLYTVLNGLIFPTPTQPRISHVIPLKALIFDIIFFCYTPTLFWLIKYYNYYYYFGEIIEATLVALNI